MEKVQWKIEGMDCTNCALTIRLYLEKEGMKDVKVNFGTGDVAFEKNGNVTVEKLASGIKNLGYSVVRDHDGHHHDEHVSGFSFLSTQLQRFLFCLPFTALLMLHMIPGI